MSAPLITRGADVPITPTGPVYIVSGSLAWGISGANGFNNNFFFTPLSQNESVCIYVKNNNPTNLHGFSVSVNVTTIQATQRHLTDCGQTPQHLAGIRLLHHRLRMVSELIFLALRRFR